MAAGRRADHLVRAAVRSLGPAVDRVVLIALDGLRADMVRPDLTPHIWALRQRGDWFVNARSVFRSYTRVCTASVMAGAPPAVHGVVGNAFHRDGVLWDLSRTADMRALTARQGPVRQGLGLDAALAQGGRRLAVVNGNSAGTALVMLPDPAAGGHWLFGPHGPDELPDRVPWDEVTAATGPPPAVSTPLIDRTAYLGRVFAEHVLGRLDPDVALLWMAEPDTSLHYRGTGHAETQLALAAADREVGRALGAIAVGRHAARTAVLVFSDHGQISCPDQIALLAAWPVLDGSLATIGRCGGVTVAARHQGAGIKALAAALQDRPELGMLLTRGGEAEAPGTLPYAAVGLDHPRAPDLVYVLRDAPGPDAAGWLGHGWTTAGDIPAGGGMHGGMQPGELGNVLLLALPGAAGRVRTAPAGLVDLAPTVLGLLGLEPPPGMVGRNLAAPDPAERRQHYSAEACNFRQLLEVARVGHAEYVIAGGRA